LIPLVAAILLVSLVPPATLIASLGPLHKPSASCPIPQAKNDTFTLFWITDTQFLSRDATGSSNNFTRTTQWIADNYAVCNGRMVIHTGDIVDDWQSQQQWSSANQAMSVLLDAGIPYTWDAGNHDFSQAGYVGNESQAFNPAYVAAREPLNWVSATHGGMDTAVSFTYDGRTFLIINIEFNGEAELGWAGSLLSQYRHALTIVATHAYIDQKGRTNSPDLISDSRHSATWGSVLRRFADNLTSLMDRNPRVFLTLNGHYEQALNDQYLARAGCRWEMMFDRQDVQSSVYPYTVADPPLGAASVVTLTFDLARNHVYVNTFNVYQSRPGDILPDKASPYGFMLFQPPALEGATRSGA
jgi:3',5'-cyclic AMP phosphodiesterase CpdA